MLPSHSRPLEPPRGSASRTYRWLTALILGCLGILGAGCQERERPPVTPPGSPVVVGSPTRSPLGAVSPSPVRSPAGATPASRPASPVASPSPISSPRPIAPPSPLGSPSPAVTPVSPFTSVAQGQFFPTATYSQTVDLLGPDQRARLAPAIVTNAEVRSPRSGTGLNPVLVVAPDVTAIDSWQERAPPGQGSVDFTTLSPTSVYLNGAAAQVLGATAGDTLDFYLGARPTQVRVDRVLAADVLPRPEPTVYLALATAQVMLGRPDQVNAVLLDPSATGAPPPVELPIVPLPTDPATLVGRLAPR